MIEQPVPFRGVNRTRRGRDDRFAAAASEMLERTFEPGRSRTHRRSRLIRPAQAIAVVPGGSLAAPSDESYSCGMSLVHSPTNFEFMAICI